ncbi:MAG TPA: hypothetical protein P5110_01140 [Candidatus Omnitrophota bacterium]|nr:hypothetical protein [Candidatus Omnitrophota bacterium]HRZ14090.1 hypothetical protein [Candidatus Omnitrophota bacterium]
MRSASAPGTTFIIGQAQGPSTTPGAAAAPMQAMIVGIDDATQTITGVYTSTAALEQNGVYQSADNTLYNAANGQMLTFSQSNQASVDASAAGAPQSAATFALCQGAMTPYYDLNSAADSTIDIQGKAVFALGSETLLVESGKLAFTADAAGNTSISFIGTQSVQQLDPTTQQWITQSSTRDAQVQSGVPQAGGETIQALTVDMGQGQGLMIKGEQQNLALFADSKITQMENGALIMSAAKDGQIYTATVTVDPNNAEAQVYNGVTYIPAVLANITVTPAAGQTTTAAPTANAITTATPEAAVTGADMSQYSKEESLYMDSVQLRDGLLAEIKAKYGEEKGAKIIQAFEYYEAIAAPHLDAYYNKPATDEWFNAKDAIHAAQVTLAEKVSPYGIEIDTRTGYETDPICTSPVMKDGLIQQYLIADESANRLGNVITAQGKAVPDTARIQQYAAAKSSQPMDMGNMGDIIWALSNEETRQQISGWVQGYMQANPGEPAEMETFNKAILQNLPQETQTAITEWVQAVRDYETVRSLDLYYDVTSDGAQFVNQGTYDTQEALDTQFVKLVEKEGVLREQIGLDPETMKQWQLSVAHEKPATTEAGEMPGAVQARIDTFIKDRYAKERYSLTGEYLKPSAIQNNFDMPDGEFNERVLGIPEKARVTSFDGKTGEIAYEHNGSTYTGKVDMNRQFNVKDPDIDTAKIDPAILGLPDTAKITSIDKDGKAHYTIEDNKLVTDGSFNIQALESRINGTLQYVGKDNLPGYAWNTLTGKYEPMSDARIKTTAGIPQQAQELKMNVIDDKTVEIKYNLGASTYSRTVDADKLFVAAPVVEKPGKPVWQYAGKVQPANQQSQPDAVSANDSIEIAPLGYETYKSVKYTVENYATLSQIARIGKMPDGTAIPEGFTITIPAGDRSGDYRWNATTRTWSPL